MMVESVELVLMYWLFIMQQEMEGWTYDIGQEMGY